MSKLLRSVFGIAYIYCLIPIIIFFLGWTRFYIALPTAIVLAVSTYFMIKNSPDALYVPAKDALLTPAENGKWYEPDTKGKLRLAAALVIILAWVLLSGIGKAVWQNDDQYYRNTIYSLLVRFQWPIKGLVDVNGDGTLHGVAMVYYIAFWLPAAVVGKVYGMAAGYAFQVVWAVIGLYLIYLLICRAMNRITLWPLIVFVFFGGLDVIGKCITSGSLSHIFTTEHIEWWAGEYQYSSFTTQLFWVFNQSIPAWLITLLAYFQKNNRQTVLLLGISMLYSTLPFIGMIPLFAYFVLSKLDKTDIKKFFTDLFTFENVIAGGAAGIISFLYLKSNSSGQKIGALSGTATFSPLMTTLFILLEVGIYYIFICKYQHKKKLFYITLVWLILCPLIRVGYASDFCMRASIPALLLLYLMVTDTIQKAHKSNKGIFAALCILLIIGSCSALHELSRVVIETGKCIKQGTALNFDVDDSDIMGSVNFTGLTEDSIFFGYISK